MSTSGAERWTEPVYLDASALVKLFVPEEESDALNQALAGLTDVIVSDLALTEMASALSRRTREHRVLIELLARSGESAALAAREPRLEERIMISTEMPRCTLTLNGGVEHGADIGARDGSPVHADADEAPRERVHHHEHPVGPQRSTRSERGRRSRGCR